MHDSSVTVEIRVLRYRPEQEDEPVWQSYYRGCSSWNCEEKSAASQAGVSYVANETC